MTDRHTFNVRATFTFAPDRIYRVELRNECLYFLRIGGQFDVDRGVHGAGSPENLAAVLILATGEALFRKHKREELIARDPNQDPEELLRLHPHNFKLTPADIAQATLLPKKWFLSQFRPHFGRLVLERTNGQKQEYHFEQLDSLKTAYAQLPQLLGKKCELHIRWDGAKSRFVKAG